MALIELRDVSKSFRRRPVLESVSLAIAPGDICALLGPNGCGKSVLFRIMCGFITPDSGAVSIHPSLLAPGHSFPQEFGIIIDQPGYLPGRTGFDNLWSLARIRNKIGENDVRDAMLAVGLDPGLEQRVRHYSLGMKQKLALAQAFMEDQQVLLLDEPFNALDDTSVRLVHDLLLALHEEGKTIVFTSHNPADVDALATRRVKIDQRRLIEVTDPAAERSSPPWPGPPR